MKNHHVENIKYRNRRLNLIRSGMILLNLSFYTNGLIDNNKPIKRFKPMILHNLYNMCDIVTTLKNSSDCHIHEMCEYSFVCTTLKAYSDELLEDLTYDE